MHYKEKALGGVNAIKRTFYHVQIRMWLKIFDSVIQPIMLYRYQSYTCCYEHYLAIQGGEEYMYQHVTT